MKKRKNTGGKFNLLTFFFKLKTQLFCFLKSVLCFYRRIRTSKFVVISGAAVGANDYLNSDLAVNGKSSRFYHWNSSYYSCQKDPTSWKLNRFHWSFFYYNSLYIISIISTSGLRDGHPSKCWIYSSTGNHFVACMCAKLQRYTEEFLYVRFLAEN